MSTKFQNIHYEEPVKIFETILLKLVLLFKRLPKETYTTFYSKPFVNIIATNINYFVLL